jgi:hypothetical protein
VNLTFFNLLFCSIIVFFKTIILWTKTVSIFNKTGGNKMNVSSIVKGIAAGAAIGGIGFIVANSTNRQRKLIKRDASRCGRALSDVVTDFTSMIR